MIVESEVVGNINEDLYSLFGPISQNQLQFLRHGHDVHFTSQTHSNFCFAMFITPVSYTHLVQSFMLTHTAVLFIAVRCENIGPCYNIVGNNYSQLMFFYRIMRFCNNDDDNKQCVNIKFIINFYF